MSQLELLPSPVLPVTTEDKWRSEQSSFRRMLPELLKQYRDQFVAIHECTVIASGADKLEVAGRAYAKVGYVPIYVGQVTNQPPSLCRIPSPRSVAWPRCAQSLSNPAGWAAVLLGNRSVKSGLRTNGSSGLMQRRLVYPSMKEVAATVRRSQRFADSNWANWNR